MANPGPHRPADALFPNRRIAIHADICVLCNEAAVDFTDDLSRKEYGISGMCQDCQDEFFSEETYSDDAPEVDCEF